MPIQVLNTYPSNDTEKRCGNSIKKPLVSIITAVFNGERFLEQTITSVLNQTYDRIEYIIVDGGSTDGTLDIIRNYQDHISCWISESDNGVYDAWNKGIDLANGQWISFIGSDDVFYNNAVENYIQYIFQTGTPDLDYISSKAKLVDDDLKVLRTIGKHWEWKKFQRYNNLAHVGSFHSKRLFDKYGRYDCQYEIAGDYEFLIRAGIHLKAAFMDKITVKMRYSGISNSRKALSETMHVKINSGGRNRALSFLEYCFGSIKFVLKHLAVGIVN